MIVKVGVKLGTIVGVAEGVATIMVARVAVKVKVGLIDTVCAPIEPFCLRQPDNRKLKPIKNNKLRLNRIYRYLAGRSTLTLLIQLPNTRQNSAPTDARPKRSGPMLQIVQPIREAMICPAQKPAQLKQT